MKPLSNESDRLSRGILLLCGMVAAMASVFLAAGTMSGAGAGACLMLMVLIWFGGSALLLRKPLLDKMEHTVCAILGLFLCLMLRLCLFDYISPDYVSFLGPWTQTMREMTVRQVLVTPIGDYNMPYLYLLLLISRLPGYDLYWIKLASVVTDLFLALALARLSAMVSRRDGVILGVFFGSLLAPTILLNSAYWGQCDGMYTCFALWGLYWGLRKRPIASMACFAIAFSLKLQAIFILPIALFLLVLDYVNLQSLLAFPITFLIVMLPALLAGRGLGDTFGIYVNQTNSYPYLTLNAPSLWALIPNDYFSRLGTAAVLLAGICTLLLLYVFLRRSGRLNKTDLMDLALLFAFAIPWLLPRMHERYFYTAEALSVLYAANHPKELPVGVIILGGGFLAYCSYLFGGMRILSNELVAALFGLTLLYLIVTILRRIERRGSSN